MNNHQTTRATVLTMVLAFLFCTLAQPSFAVAQESDSNGEIARVEVSGTTMGVVSYSVIAYCDPELQSEIVVESKRALESVNQSMSTYIADSEVSRFNSSDSTDWFPVSKETALVVSRAIEISEKTDGAFDITVQPLVQLWKFGTEKDSPSLPDAAAIERTLKLCGYKNLSVRDQPPAIRKAIPGLQIDLSAIAKGYAVDRVHNNLRALGLTNFLVEVGGEIRASGEKPDNVAWNVGIEPPTLNSELPLVRTSYQEVELYHLALASSGDYRNFYEIDGKRYSHTIDPKTGWPVEHDVAAASVIAPDCMAADAWATALMVLGKPGTEVAEKAGIKAMVLQRKDGKVVATRTSNFPKPDSSKTGSQRDPAKEKSLFQLIIVASGFFLFAIIAMAIGVIFGRERIKGSCGGIAALDNPDVSPECSLCSRATECNDLKKEMKKRKPE